MMKGCEQFEFISFIEFKKNDSFSRYGLGIIQYCFLMKYLTYVGKKI